MSERGFWNTLTYPAIGLAPMDGVTDAAFRYMVAKYGHPALVITEFTSVEGIRAGAERLLDDFLYSELERPVVAQVFGSDPEAFYVGALAAAALGFDGIDINMGCPAKNVAERGAGAALIRDPVRAKQIIRQVQRAVLDWANGISLEAGGVPERIFELVAARNPNPLRKLLPVSVKTRIGYDTVVITDWIRHLLETDPANISLHGRTLKQGYAGEANWDAIAQAAVIVHAEAPGTTLLGNGDVTSLDDAHRRITEYGTDGVLIGRAAFGNPWIFTGYQPTFEDRMAAALEHSCYLHSVLPGKGFIRIRKHLLDYCRGIDGAKDLRIRLMKITTLEEIEEILSGYAYPSRATLEG